MTERRGGVILWIGYAIAFLICDFFYTLIFGRFPLLGSVPNFLPVGIALAAVMEGSVAGSIFGLCAGLFTCLVPGGAGAGMIFLGALLGMLTGFAADRKPKKLLGVCLLGAFVSLLVTELIRAGWMIYSGAGSFGIICRLAGMELAYSLVLALPAYPLFRFVHQKLGTY